LEISRFAPVIEDNIPKPPDMPPHHSTRSTRSKGNVAADDDFIVDSEPETPRRKLRKTGKNAVRKPRGRGKLRMLPEMPLDILFEVSKPAVEALAADHDRNTY